MESETNIVPMRRLMRVPSLSLERPTAGEMKRDWEMDMPPMRAYSSWVALGKVLLERKWARKIAQACQEVSNGTCTR
jgi:hypothetical protein